MLLRKKHPLKDQDPEQHAQELAQRYIITDGHIDLPFRMKIANFRLQKEWIDVTEDTDGDFDYVKAKQGGLNAPFMSIYVPASYQETGGAKVFADSLINLVGMIPEKYPDKFALATTPQEVEVNFAEGLISLPMGMENGAPIGDSLENVQYFYDRGVRYVTLTHSKVNKICDSSYDTVRVWNGLSPFGEEVVREMNRVGMMVDVSHISDSAFYDVMNITQAPVIASHSSCRKFVPGFERNMNDDMIQKLADNGGSHSDQLWLYLRGCRGPRQIRGGTRSSGQVDGGKQPNDERLSRASVHQSVHEGKSQLLYRTEGGRPRGSCGATGRGRARRLRV